MRFLILLLLIPFAYGLEWNEILFDAEGNDNGLEYIELLGTENLSGCTITDTHSSDTLELLQEGTNIILIVEEDHSYETDATLYSAGKAIGNGLGNSHEELTITCEDFELITTYNVSEIENFEPGKSISYDGTWITTNATPGFEEKIEAPLEEVETGGSSFCNTTLIITVSNTTSFTGDPVFFIITSAAYASFTVEANETIILEGDTLTRNEYSFVMPESDVMISAFANSCDAKQRAKRKILFFERPIIVNESVETVVEQNITEEMPAKIEEIRIPEPEPPVIATTIIYDEDENIVPWVSAFGIITLLVSVGLYKYERWDRD